MNLPIRIALIGNMNNNHFVLARYLRDEGYDCRLFVLPYEPQHFRPEADSNVPEDLNMVSFPEWGSVENFHTHSAAAIKSWFAGFTHFIGCGTAPAILAKAGIRLNLFIPYGSDLYQLPFKWPRNPAKWINHFSFIRHQRKGIGEALNCSIADSSALFNKCLARLKFKGRRLSSGVPMVYIKIPESGTNEKNEFSRFKEGNPLIIIHQSRHCWKNEPDLVSLKDNHKLFEGIALFRRKFPDKKVLLITLEYGKDVDASKKHIADLGITDSVIWLPLMPRKKLMSAVAVSDIVAGEFRNSWFTYGVVFEAMAAAKPVMHYRNDALYPEMELYPMLHASNPEEIAFTLEKYHDDRAALREIGVAGKQWYLKHSVHAALSDIRKIVV